MVSVIIACRKIDEALYCIEECQKLDYPYFEIIVLPDYDEGIRGGDFVKFFPTGKVLPSEKRDIGVEKANAMSDIIAFIDADAYPRKDWLKRAVFTLRSNPDLLGICGPGVLPPDSGMLERAAEKVLCLLPFSYRVRQEKSRFVNDYPTFNLILRKEAVEEVGGFGCQYLTGEDTVICKKITQLGSILYSPYVVVFHKRRSLYRPFLRQVATYATHRGYFFKRGIGESRKWIYLMPSFMLMLLLGLCLLSLYMLFISR